MMSYKMSHCVYVQLSKETRNQLIGKHFIRIVLLHCQREKAGSTVDGTTAWVRI